MEENKKTPGGESDKRSIKFFNPQKIAKDIINILAKHEVSVDAIDTIFDTVKHELSKQKIQKVDSREDGMKI